MSEPIEYNIKDFRYFKSVNMLIMNDSVDRIQAACAHGLRVHGVTRSLDFIRVVSDENGENILGKVYAIDPEASLLWCFGGGKDYKEFFVTLTSRQFNPIIKA